MVEVNLSHVVRLKLQIFTDLRRW